MTLTELIDFIALAAVMAYLKLSNRKRNRK